MARWSEFAAAAPEMAEAGRRLLYQYGIGLGYLATVRKDGGPRVHPFCPILHGEHLYGLIGPSPKRQDLLRDSRFAIHSFAAKDVDDEFYLAGRAIHRHDEHLVDEVLAAFRAGGGQSSADEMLFEFDIEHALHAKYKKRGEPNNWPPKYTKWHAPDVP